jgi:putative ABC transport system permease protein
MLKKLLISFSLAQQNIRNRLFHTLLSILGIVIGVGALVTVLSLIDGMEKYAREQITTTTSLKAIVVNTETHKRVNNLRLKKEDYAYLTYEQFEKLLAAMTYPVKGYLQVSRTSEVRLLPDTAVRVGAAVGGISAYPAQNTGIAAGAIFSKADVEARQKVAFVSHAFAVQAAGKCATHSLLGKSVQFEKQELKVIGILKDDKQQVPKLFVPITLFSDAQLKADPPQGILEAENVEHVPLLKTEAQAWLKKNLQADPSDFVVLTNELRVKQAAQGFLLFRVIMGLIVGISVVVGGIGVMNVLLISVTERTVEIGVRKAVGAKKRDILLQFLAESVTVSVFGSFLGLVLGILATLAIIPIVKMVTNVPFQAAYTTDTFLLITFVAVVVGVVFGTFPALKAARLDPVEAIRRE